MVTRLELEVQCLSDDAHRADRGHDKRGVVARTTVHVQSLCQARGFVQNDEGVHSADGVVGDRLVTGEGHKEKCVSLKKKERN